MGIDKNGVKAAIESGKTALGIEFGSTRIKAVLVGEDNAPIARSPAQAVLCFATIPDRSAQRRCRRAS